jgi:hypothetical protein
VVVDTSVADMFALENIQLVSVVAVAVAFGVGGVAPASSPRTDFDTDSGPSSSLAYVEEFGQDE